MYINKRLLHTPKIVPLLERLLREYRVRNCICTSLTRILTSAKVYITIYNIRREIFDE